MLLCLLIGLWGALTARRERGGDLRELILRQLGGGTSGELQVPSPVCSTVGPCALEYTKMKTADHFWTDPSADELVQRHRIHSSHLRQDSPTKRPALCVRRVGSEREGLGHSLDLALGPTGDGVRVLKVTHGLTPVACPDIRSRRGIRVAAWMIGHPSPPATTLSPCTRTPGPPCFTARTTFWFSR